MKRPRNRYQRAELAYAYLLNAIQTGICFTPEDLAKSSGYRPGTARSHLSKKWYWFTTKQKDGRYTAQSFGDYSFVEFKKDLSQVVKRTPVSAQTPVVSAHQEMLLSRRQIAIVATIAILWGLTLVLLRKQRWWFIPL